MSEDKVSDEIKKFWKKVTQDEIKTDEMEKIWKKLKPGKIKAAGLEWDLKEREESFNSGYKTAQEKIEKESRSNEIRQEAKSGFLKGVGE